MNEDIKPLMVSVWCMTYNHEPYIRQCLDGFVMQKTNFRFEAIVHDDASTDGTADIIREYAEKYPDIIKPIYETENQYSKCDGSLDRIMNEACKGKYIACCEGDDYWTDSLKLQKQVDYMELHPECSLIHTAFDYLEDGALRKKDIQDVNRTNISLLESGVDLRPYILDGNQYVIQTMTVLYRRADFILYKEFVSDCEGKFLMGDTQLWVFLLSRGTLFFLPEVSSIYRLHQDSATHQPSAEMKLRFFLSCAEMRVYMSEKCDIPAQFIKKFMNQYNWVLTEYLWFNPNYVPFITPKYHSTTDRLKFKFLRLKIVSFFGKVVYQSYKKLKKFFFWGGGKKVVWGLTTDFVMSLPIRFIRTKYCSFFFNSMGKNVYIGKYLDIREPSKIDIGNNVVINKKVLLDGRGGLIICNNVDIAQEVCIWTLQHDYNDDFHRLKPGKVLVSDYTWLCHRSVILPNVTIGRGAVVAANAVVVKDVEPMAVVGGVPSKVIGVRQSELLYELNYSPAFYYKN